MPYRPQWLSEGHEDLLAALKDTAQEKVDFEVVVVGSGYGGAVAAARLASATDETGNPLSVCLLERGREYVPGTFPSRFSELPGHVRFSRFDDPKPKGQLDGLYDFRIGADVSTLLGSGLGGGSLINANVAVHPHNDVWDDPAWPEALRNDLPRLKACFTDAGNILGAAEAQTAGLHKFRALERVAQRIEPGLKPQAAEIAVTTVNGPNPQTVEQKACIGCGDCVTGCNFWAKNTLAMNYLPEAKRYGTRIFTNVTVTRVEKADGFWRVWFRLTAEEHPPREPRERAVRARHVILAAGTFGSTEILMRSRVHGLRLSDVLGRRFSGNGDMISVLYGQSDRVNAAPEETKDFRARKVGPTITGIVEHGATRADRIVIEELAIPAPLRRLFEEVVTSAALPVRLARRDDEVHAPAGDDPAAVDPGRIDNCSIFAAMGDDGARGRLELVQGWETAAGDGAIRIAWPKAGADLLYEKQDALLRCSEEPGSLYLPSPLWKPLPEALSKMLSGPKPDGKLFTVHPLGGCPMGDHAEVGVVDHIGRVYDGDEGTSAHDGLLVLDGSIIPTALGINPLLTIAALAERAVELYAASCGWVIGGNAVRTPLPPPPTVRKPEVPAEPVTAVRFAERMSGKLKLSPFRAKADAELEVVFGAIGGNMRFGGVGDRERIADFLRLQPHTVRIQQATLKLDRGKPATVCGTVYWMERGRTRPFFRTAWALWTWVRTRAIADFFENRRAGRARGLCQFWKDRAEIWALASNVGEVRHLRYDLTLQDDLECAGTRVLKAGKRLQGLKTFRYVTDGNPWRQLSELEVTVKRRWLWPRSAGTLEVDLLHLFRRFAAQFQIVRQLDQPTAIMDIASILLFMARVALKIHFWSFRAPEYEHYDPERENRRRPRALDGLECKRHRVRVEVEETREHLELPLTRYRCPSIRPESRHMYPVLCIHGFGSGGVQFAHPKLKRNLVRHLAEGGFDVWVAELRTSIAVESSPEQWTLDAVAKEDIPAIVRRILDLTKQPQVDVVAHCIGSAMFCTSVLAGRLQNMIRRAVLLQVGPLITLSKGNKIRGYFAAALRRYILADHVDSSVDDRADWLDAILDRVLSTYPYPDSERKSHRLCPPWKAHTHIANCNRSAAVFGRLFQHANVGDAMLNALGDLLGHTNLTTFEQTVHYTFLERLTDSFGCNAYVTDDNIRKYFGFPVHFLHGEKNDVFHPDTTERSEKLLQDVFGANHPVSRSVIRGYGHLDPLIGRNAENDVYRRISGFLSRDRMPAAAGVPAGAKCYPRRPLIGPLLGWTRLENGHRTARIWCRTHDTESPGQFLIAVVLDDKGGAEPGYTFLAPLRERGDGDADTLDLLGVIDVELPVRQRDYKIVIASAHSSAEAEPSEVERVEGGIPPRPLPDVASGLDARNLSDPKAVPSEDRDAIGRAVLEHRKGWIDAVREGENATCTFHKGYDERPDSVVLKHSLLDQLQPKRNEMVFALGSCRYPATRVDREQADAMFAGLREEIGKPPGAPSLLLLIGDQIYADATAGLFDPKNRRERFNDSYREVWTAPNAREVLRRIPTYMMMDDHEAGDDWHPADPGERKLRRWGLKTFEEFQLSHSPNNPDLVRKALRPPYYYQFESGSFPFFVCDTRSGREGHSLIMGDTQHGALTRWLVKQQSRDESRPKFVISPSIVVPFLEATGGKAEYKTRSDGWDGFPESLTLLFSFIARNCIRNVVFLCGDPHLSMITRIEYRGAALQDLTSVCIVASPLYAPFPFANRQPVEFLDDNGGTPLAVADLEATMQYSVINRKYVEGDSFTIVKAERMWNGWEITASVHLREGAPRETVVELP